MWIYSKNKKDFAGHSGSMDQKAPAVDRTNPPRPAPLKILIESSFQTLIDKLYPPCCLACDIDVQMAGGLCSTCWSGLEFSGPTDATDPTQVRSSFTYAGTGRTLVLRLKHGDREELAQILGRWMTQSGAEILAQADFLVPVPLHWTRMLQRKYNQATALCRAISHFSSVPTLEALRRTKRTQSMGHKSRLERKINVQSAFQLHKNMPALKDKIIILIDDVFTTGATTQACKLVLQAQGAKQVYILVAAQVKERNIDHAN